MLNELAAELGAALGHGYLFRLRRTNLDDDHQLWFVETHTAPN